MAILLKLMTPHPPASTNSQQILKRRGALQAPSLCLTVGYKAQSWPHTYCWCVFVIARALSGLDGSIFFHDTLCQHVAILFFLASFLGSSLGLASITVIWMLNFGMSVRLILTRWQEINIYINCCPQQKRIYLIHAESSTILQV